MRMKELGFVWNPERMGYRKGEIRIERRAWNIYLVFHGAEPVRNRKGRIWKFRTMDAALKCA